MAFETRKQFVKHNLTDEHLNMAKKECEDEVEDEILERVYDAEEDDYVFKPKDNNKDIIKTKTKTTTETETNAETKSKTEGNIYTRIKHECKECHEEFRNKIALTTHSYSHNRKYL